ncbi:hypothetical protein POM88_037090 [Heracleum sosnowskyi]|uniref:F-box associated beta-propeller type 3 domain-containing protein n=1 Tax=Heracleum sosnowskyi TaxID=360622 RepID=A0AAD8MGC2_9APIA|nr:hypothetical protein POM88_037090 [Heracleum sosnowskyi]
MAKKGKPKKRNHKPTKSPLPSNPSTNEEEEKPIPISTLEPEPFLDVLYRFSVKSLLRCRSLSKSWTALIGYPAFIQKHIDFNSSRNQQLICNSLYDRGRRRLIAFLSVKGPPIPVLDINLNFTERSNYPRIINFPDFSRKMVLAGSINGIVCLSHHKEMLGQYVALWNPAIRHWKPIALPQSRSWENVSVGLGFDVLTNDFKIICIVPAIASVDPTEKYKWSRVDIYSANRESWDDADERGLIPFIPVLYLEHCKFIVKGVPYWIGIDIQARQLKVLGGVDPRTGLFRKVLFPEHVQNENTLVHVVNLRNSVVALIHSPGEYPNQMIDLYELDDNTAKWTRMYRIGPLVLETQPLVYKTLRLPQCLITGEIVLEAWSGQIRASDMVYYFCDTNTSRVFRNSEIEELVPHWHESYSHVESLVCLKGMVQIGKEHIRKKTDPKNWSEYLPQDLEAALHL